MPDTPEKQNVLPDAKGAGDGFLQGSLGPGSSHPDFALKRLAYARKYSLMVGTAVVAVVAWHLHKMWRGQWDATNLFSFLSFPVSHRYWALGMAFGITAALTAALTIRASIANRTEAPPRRDHLAWMEGVVLFMMLLALCAGLAWLSRPAFLPIKQRIMLLCAGILPIYLLKWWFDRHPRGNGASGDQEEGWGLVRTLKELFTAVVVLASSLLVLGEVATVVSRFIMVGLQSLLNALAGAANLAFLGPLAANLSQFLTRHIGSAVTSYLFQFFGAAIVVGLTMKKISAIGEDIRRASEAAGGQGAPKQSAAHTEPKEKPTRSWVGRLRDWVQQTVLRRPPPQEPPPFDGPSAAWAKELNEKLNRLPDQTQPVGVEGAKKQAPNKEPKEKPARSWLGRLWDWIRPTISRRQSPEESTDKPNPVSDQPQPATDFVVEWLPAEAHKPSWEKWFFGGGRPSPSQESAFARFYDGWFNAQMRAFQAHGNSDAQQQAKNTHADLFIESPPGAGVTTLLHGCAVFAAAARGQRVLLLVTDEDEKKDHINALRRILDQAELQHLIGVGGISPGEAQSYFGPRARQDFERKELAPEIIVATPKEYDAALLDGIVDDMRVRAFLLSIEVILIDGWDRIQRHDNDKYLPWLVHLPFLLDKHRLALSTEGRICQVVFGARPLPSPTEGETMTIVRQELAKRLFGGDGAAHGQFVTLTPWVDPSPVNTLKVTVNNGSREEDGLCQILAEIRNRFAEEKVALVQVPNSKTPATPGSEDKMSECNVERLELKILLDPKDGIDRGYFEKKEIRWLVVVGVSERDRSALYWRLSRAQPERLVLVLFDLQQPAERESAVTHQLPVFVSPEASALLVSHLFSILPILHPNIPIRREQFARFGLSWDPGSLVEHAREGLVDRSSRRISQEWRLEWDGDLSLLLKSAASEGHWPAIMVRRDIAISWQQTGFGWPVDEGHCLDFDDKQQVIRKALVRCEQNPARYSTWVNSRGLVLATKDLFLLDKYFHKQGDETSSRSFHPARITSCSSPAYDSSGIEVGSPPAACGVLIEVQEDLKPDELLPEIPDVATGVKLSEDLDIRGPYRVRASGRADWNEYVLRLATTTDSGPIQSTEHLFGLVSADGQQRLPVEGEIKYTVETGVTIIFLGGVLPEKDKVKTLRSRFAGDWATDAKRQEVIDSRAEFWPLLTYCMQSAVKKCAPRLASFCRFFAFHPTLPKADHRVAEDTREHAVLLILENLTTIGTALQVMRTLLDDPDFRKAMLDEMEASVQRREEGKDEANFVGPKPAGEKENLKGSVKAVRELIVKMRGGPPKL